ncbi:NrdH-redoxin [Synechococcus sp. RSCCF101]|uniref:glutaredoxin family protein n=1 Tax=Synechococcus sp. RSCCF101 TaxID=2511069 RepID=UPI0012457D91|nr:glutaredoxin domain-containing protein [Synechococcus sp. RSCCF101]QEY31204.1 NrdH-redoxin [Synechococcus sp. RSCCF101]
MARRSLRRSLTRWLAALGAALLLLAGVAPAATPPLQVFVREGCPHCAAAKAFLPELQQQHPELQIVVRDLSHDATAAEELEALSREAGIAAPGVPSFVLGGELLVGYDNPEGRGRQLLALVERAGTPAPPRPPPGLAGLSAQQLGLPLFTLLVGLVDGFNPCAMWVLLFLLSLLVHLRDRRRMALIAGTFVLVSGAVYFLFLAAWLNVFWLLGMSTPLRLLLAALALGIGAINLRDGLRRSGGFTLSIPGSAKPGLYQRMRGVLQAPSLGPALLGVAALAVVVNTVELLCTAGLPALYTAVLAQQQLPAAGHAAYLGLYIAAYIADDALMVGLAVLAISSHRLGERGGRQLKLLSGGVMALLGTVLLLRPGWLL